MSAALSLPGLAIEDWLAPFLPLERTLRARGPGWLQALRGKALASLRGEGFPTRRSEQWKYTDLRPVVAARFHPAEPAQPGDGDIRLAAALAEQPIVIINGRPSLPLPGPLDGRLIPLTEAWHQHSELAGVHLGRYASFDQRPFVALNTALFEDGLLVRIPAGSRLEAPVVIVHCAVPHGQPIAVHSRTLVLAGRNSRAAILEAWQGPDGQPYLSTAVTEVVLEQGALLDYTRLEQEGSEAFHFSALDARLERDSHLVSNSIALGGRLTRHEIGVVAADEGACCSLNGLYVPVGSQHVDNYTVVDHARPQTTSSQLYKGILDGRAEAVFQGRIIIRPQAQKSDAVQRNRNLLLSQAAVVNAKPQLEIQADDVRCAHGAAVGQVDQEALFYLRSRGLPVEQARRLLTLAFAEEVLERLKHPLLAEHLRQRLRERFGRGQEG